MTKRPTLEALEDRGDFIRRHIGPDERDLAVMLAVFVFLFSRPSCALAVAWAGLVTILACRLAQKHLGGMSGDVAGFSITLGEASALLILAVF